MSGCEFAEESATTPKCQINGYIHCDGCNCYYKQLQRKATENRKLECVLDEIEEMVQTIMETNKIYPLQVNLGKILEIIREAKGEE